MSTPAVEARIVNEESKGFARWGQSTGPYTRGTSQETVSNRQRLIRLVIAQRLIRQAEQTSHRVQGTCTWAQSGRPGELAILLLGLRRQQNPNRVDPQRRPEWHMQQLQEPEHQGHRARPRLPLQQSAPRGKPGDGLQE